ncbi:MAG: hypothetical protein IKZ54_01830 [Bacteroidales bacterium]|nr:hypothetical protein [Bacteroidales bacterium]
MEKIESKDSAKERVEYTFDMLWNDIQDNNLEEDVEGAAPKDNAAREYRHKRMVMQMLIYFAATYSSEEYNDDDKLENAIEVKVTNDELLSGYLFHVSQNPQFDYSWNYMRKRKNSYSKFLMEAVRFLNNVITDINKLAVKPFVHTDVHVVFDDIFDVVLMNEKPYVKTNLLWENFYKVATVKKNYNMGVKAKDCLLVAGSRKKPSDAEKLIDAALEKVKAMVVESE